MSESAFGIDHGHVEKAFRLPGVGQGFKPMGATAGASRAMGGMQRMAGAAKPKMQRAAGQMRPMANQAKSFMSQNRKPLAAGAAVGAGTGYMAGRR